jgi:type IV pilus assembly protein PilO
MNIDLKSLNEIELDELDLENIGSWPLVVKVILYFLTAGLVAVLTYTTLVSSEIEAYERAKEKEQALRSTFRQKYDVASKLEIYRQQMTDMEDKFSQLLRRLPTSNETSGLITDLTYIATSIGLTGLELDWRIPEVKKEFYTEILIKIEIIGSYHDFGEFVSKVAAAKRIISLHDFTIKQSNEPGMLRFNVIARTYRYEGESQ